MAVPVKHTGEPEAGLAVPYDQEPRRPSVAVAALVGGGVIGLPLLYLLYLGFAAFPVAMGVAVAAAVLLVALAFLGSRVFYST